MINDPRLFRSIKLCQIIAAFRCIDRFILYSEYCILHNIVRSFCGDVLYHCLNGYTSFVDLYEKIDISIDYYFFCCIIFYLEASRGAAAQSVIVKPAGCGFDPPLEEMKYLLKFIFLFFALVSRKARRWVLPLNTQCLQNSAESGERRVLTLGSLGLPCCVRDTTWSWFTINSYTKISPLRY